VADLDDVRRDVARSLEDAAYVAVGLAVLELQKAQVRRRALVERVGRLGGLIVNTFAGSARQPDSPSAASEAEPGVGEDVGERLLEGDGGAPAGRRPQARGVADKDGDVDGA
jgi:hypothetical protein